MSTDASISKTPGEPMELQEINECVCDALYEALRSMDGCFRSPEALMVGRHVKIVVKEVRVGVKDREGFVNRVNNILEHRGLDARVSYSPSTDSGLLEYRYRDSILKIAICFTQLQRSDDVVIDWDDSGAKMVGRAPEEIIENLAAGIAKWQQAYTLICFVEIYDRYKERLDRSQREQVVAKCRDAIKSVEDFGMAMSLDFTRDERILPDLDIFEYLARFETLAGVVVSAEQEARTNLF